jgi:hypothetical protein
MNENLAASRPSKSSRAVLERRRHVRIFVGAFFIAMIELTRAAPAITGAIRDSVRVPGSGTLAAR